MSLPEQNNKPSLFEELSKYFGRRKEAVLKFFKPQTTSGIRRLQIFQLSGIVSCVVLISYGTIFLFFYKSVSQRQTVTAGKRPEPTYIESAASKADTESAWRYKLQTALQNLQDTVTGLKSTFEESTKTKLQEAQTREQDLEARFSQFETKIRETFQDQSLSTNNRVPSPSQNQVTGKDQERLSIQTFPLNLKEMPHHKRLKTVDTTIPAGAFAKTVLLSGLDASASMNASSDPRPMLLRLIDHGTLPRRFQSDLKDCHCTAGAFGDLSSERVYARLEKLTCIERATGEIIETQVAGYIAGSDGKAGIRGVVASKDGQLLARSLVGGMFAGLSNVANPQNRQPMTNPFFPGSSKVSPLSLGETFTSGMASGASSALDRLSQYYIDRAEQLQPVIQITAGQVVDIVFTEGTFMGSQSIKQDIEKTRELARTQGSPTREEK